MQEHLVRLMCLFWDDFQQPSQPSGELATLRQGKKLYMQIIEFLGFIKLSRDSIKDWTYRIRLDHPGKLTWLAGTWTRIEEVFRIENGDIPGSYVRLPEGIGKSCFLLDCLKRLEFVAMSCPPPQKKPAAQDSLSRQFLLECVSSMVAATN